MSPTSARRLPSVHPHPLPAEPPDGDGVCVRVRAPLASCDVEQICERVRAGLETGCVRDVICHVQGEADLAVVEVLVRLELLARRAGARVHVRATGTGLDELLRLTGLTDALGRESR